MLFRLLKQKIEDKDRISLKELKNILKEEFSLLRDYKEIKTELSGITKEISELDERLPKTFSYDKGLHIGTIVNITANSNLEKNYTRPGSIYYDKNKDIFRICTKKGWKTLKNE